MWRRSGNAENQTNYAVTVLVVGKRGIWAISSSQETISCLAIFSIIREFLLTKSSAHSLEQKQREFPTQTPDEAEKVCQQFVESQV